MNRRGINFRIEAGPNYRLSTEHETGITPVDGSDGVDGVIPTDLAKEKLAALIGVAVLLSAGFKLPAAEVTAEPITLAPEE